MSPQTHTPAPPLAALREELASALASLAALHQAMAEHPDCGPREAHRMAVGRARAEMAHFNLSLAPDARWAASLSPTYARPRETRT
jgi:hypothetical protein